MSANFFLGEVKKWFGQSEKMSENRLKSVTCQIFKLKCLVTYETSHAAFVELFRIFKFRVFVRHFRKLTSWETDIWMIQINHPNGSSKWIMNENFLIMDDTLSDILTHESIFWHFLTPETKKSRIFLIFTNCVFYPCCITRN